MNRSRVTGDLASHGNIFVDIANDRVGIGSTIPGQKLSLPDNAKIALGNSADLQIFHDGTHSRINAVNTGFLAISSGADALTLSAANRIDISDDFIRLRSRDGSDVYMTGTVNSSVDLYFNGSQKLVTSNTGVTVTGTVAATSYTGDGSALTGISVGIATTAASMSGITTVLDLSKDGFKITASGITTVDVRGGTEGNSHTLRIVNSGITTIGFSTYFLFPSGGLPNIPTTSGTISLISFTVHRQGAVGIATQLLAGASVSFA